MNQRASHFTLGSVSQNYGSVYKKDFLPKEASHLQAQTKNPFRSSSVNPNEKSSFSTTNKAMYKGW